MKIDLTTTPLSRRGNWMSFAAPQKQEYQPLGPGVYLRSNHARGIIVRELFKLELLDDAAPISSSFEATADGARGATETGGWAEICFTAHTGVRIRGQGCRVRLTAVPGENSTAYAPQPDTWVFNLRAATRRYACQTLTGTATLHQQAAASDTNFESTGMRLTLSPDAEGQFELAVDEFWSTWIPPERESFDDLRQTVRNEFEAFHHSFPTLSASWQSTGELAAYVLWSCTQSPCGQLPRESIFMSLNWMDQVWSWDHCFNAMALAPGHPDLAWDQWMLPFDLQDEHGALPDGFNDVFKHYNFCKPPVHGWTVLGLLATAPEPSATQLEQIYTGLQRQTRWFLDQRTLAGQTLPYYLHGNDSGWDNSTMFDQGVPLMAPDLAALLVVQTEALVVLAEKIGQTADAAHWRAVGDQLLIALLQESWNGSLFQPRRVDAQGRALPVDCNSLIPFIPLFLGKRLPADVMQTLITGLERFITAHGLATEAPDSPLYTTDGYWRGPVWAPSTYLIVSGLRHAGKHDIADRIAKAFCHTCAEGGFAENFNALTGEPLRDKAYTWTASVFLLLAADFRT